MEFSLEEMELMHELSEEFNVSNLMNHIESLEMANEMLSSQAKSLRTILDSGDKHKIRNWRNYLFV